MILGFRILELLKISEHWAKYHGLTSDSGVSIDQSPKLACFQLLKAL